MLKSIRKMRMKSIKLKSQILVEKGVKLIGCLDELNILKEDQIFFQYLDPISKRFKTFTGFVLITRNPCLHPGDIQMAYSIGDLSPPLMNYYRNCICFSQRGKVPLPSKLSGGDLGFLFFNF